MRRYIFNEESIMVKAFENQSDRNEVEISAAEGTNDALKNASEKVDEMSREAKEKVEEVNDVITEYIRGCPYKSILMASVIGLAFGMLVKR